MNSDLLYESSFRRWWRVKAKEYAMKPHTGKLWLDIFYIFVLSALESSILKSLGGAYGVIDLLTPWLCLSIIQKKAGPATLLVFVAALVQEAQSSVPSGTYICIYWIIANIIIQVRPALSWRSVTPWMVVFFLSSFFLILFESMVNIILSGVTRFDLMSSVMLFVRLTISVLFGLYLCRPWLAIDADEPVPQ